MKYFIFFLLLISSKASGQNGPWNSPLKIAWSTDGITFGPDTIFQDSSGVPCVIRWKGDTLIAAFQWFRAPNPSPTWDRVAVKFSYDNGISWTTPTPIIINGLPLNFQRPFDPTLTVIANDSIRIYYSSSDGIPMGLDSSVNTYSASGADGINYEFEPTPRVDVLTNKVIDPAVIRFNNSWHYASPIGAPQQGAYHFISPDGINFSQVADIPSDMIHNWTGNYMVEDSSELRFYGTGQPLWYNSSPNGGAWNGFVNTNIYGGDPSALKIGTNNYLIVFVGQPYNTGISEYLNEIRNISIYPNPATENIIVINESSERGINYSIFDFLGRSVYKGRLDARETIIDIHQLQTGLHIIRIESGHTEQMVFIKE